MVARGSGKPPLDATVDPAKNTVVVLYIQVAHLAMSTGPTVFDLSHFDGGEPNKVTSAYQSHQV